MKDYTIDEKSKSRYVVDFTEGNNGTYTVYFADGSVFEGIGSGEANLNKIKEVQEQQAKQGVNNLSLFQSRKTKAGVMTGLSAVGSFAAATAVTMIPAVGNMIQGQDPVIIATGIGVITLLGTIPALAKFVCNGAKVCELEKIQYLYKHMEELNSFGNYKNALAGLNKDLKKMIKNSDDPFSIINIDSYSIEELKRIISNIEKEKEFGFIYPEGEEDIEDVEDLKNKKVKTKNNK